MITNVAGGGADTLDRRQRRRRRRLLRDAPERLRHGGPRRGRRRNAGAQRHEHLYRRHVPQRRHPELRFLGGLAGSYPPSITFNGGTLQYAASNTFDVSADIAPIAAGAGGDHRHRHQQRGLQLALERQRRPDQGRRSARSTLNVVNSFTGPTTVNGGTLAIADPAGNALAQSSGVTVNAGGHPRLERSRGHRGQPGRGRQRELE